MNKVSVIVPIYKVEKHLDRCINSIVNQTYKDLEIILVDDGSPDACPKKCDEWAEKDSRIKVIHKVNGGVSSARNAGLKKATGKYIYFIDSDDEIEKDALEIACASIIKNNSDMVIWGYKLISEEKIEEISEGSKDGVLITNKSEFLTLYKRVLLSALWNKLYKREKIKTTFKEGLNWGEDILFNLHYMTNIQSYNILSECLYKYYFYSNPNALSNASCKKKLEQTKSIFKYKYLLIKKLFPTDKDVLSAVCGDLIGHIKCYIAEMSKNNSYKSIKFELRDLLSNEEVCQCLDLYVADSIKEKICVYLMKKKFTRALYLFYK